MKTTLVSAFLCVVSGTAAACPGYLSAQIKPGHFGAESVHAYKDMVKLQSQGRIEELRTMIRESSVTELPGGKTACLHDSSRLSFRTLISAPGLEDRYWVHLKALHY
jgi:hypothetical protein